MVDERTVIGVDPRKASWTAVVADNSGRRVAALRVPVSPAGYRKLHQFVGKYPNPVWAVEGAYGLGAPLTSLLSADGIPVLDVPAKLAARTRPLSTGHGRKTDEDDALAVAVVAVHDTTLRPAVTDQGAAALDLLTEHRDNLVQARTQAVNPLHALLNLLVLAGAPRNLSAGTAAALLRRVRPADTLGNARRQVAMDLLAEIRRLDAHIKTATEHLTAQLQQVRTTLTEIPGIGTITAAKVLGRTGPVARFPTEAHFAAYTGAAPREVSSGDHIRHRLNRGGDRQLNRALHTIAITQIARPGSDGRQFYDRKRAEGKTGKEALRALKRRLAGTVYRTMLNDYRTHTRTGPAGQPGKRHYFQRDQLTPHRWLFGSATHRTRHPTAYLSPNLTKRRLKLSQTDK
jgi:transposase